MKTSSSRTDSKILTLTSPFENLVTEQGVRGVPSLRWMEVTVRGLFKSRRQNGHLTAQPRWRRAPDGYSLWERVMKGGKAGKGRAEPVSNLTELPCNIVRGGRKREG